jgi:hypothetical protein
MGIESSVLRCVGGQTTVAWDCHEENGGLSMVRCKICNVVEHCDKLFVLKFEGLQKCEATKKAKCVYLRVLVREYYNSSKS